MLTAMRPDRHQLQLRTQSITAEHAHPDIADLPLCHAFKYERSLAVAP